MDTNRSASEIKNPSEKHLTILQTCTSGLIMGFIAYNGSFSTVPIVFTSTALIFGTKSLITIYMTAFALLAAGYLHTHASRTGMSVSTRIFHGFYIAKPKMRNRRQFEETRWQSLNRYFLLVPINALVLNLMWETFTIFYIIQTFLMTKFLESSISTNILESHLILLHGITRYLAGCLSGISTGIINHLWQRYQAHRDISYAILNTDKKKLKLEKKERRKLLSPTNLENWMKASTMALGALFFLASNIPNRTELHLLDLSTKKFINDILVIHGGWLFLRDSAMLVFKKHEKPLRIPLMVEEVKIAVENQAELLRNKEEV